MAEPLIERTSKVALGRNKVPHKLAWSTAELIKIVSKKIIVIFVLILVMITVLGRMVLNNRNAPSKKAVESQSNLDSTSEATEKLKEVYEKEKGISLGEFAPRYSIFENTDYGYRFAYPVGFSYQWNRESVAIIPKSNKGRITVTGKNGTFDVKVDSSGTSEKEAEIVQAAAEFIRQTFEFTGTSQTGTKERFDTSDGPIYKF